MNLRLISFWVLLLQELVTVATLLDSWEWIVESKPDLLPQDCSWHVIVCASLCFFFFKETIIAGK